VFISSIKIKNFKRIEETNVPLGPITVVVGGNNSGKSCVLQAPHFAVNLLQAIVIEGDNTIPAQNLRYLPTGDVLDLSHGERLTEETAPVQITFEVDEAINGTDKRAYKVGLSRGEGLNILIESDSDDQAETAMSNSLQPFSIYVPGLAGIPLQEEYRSDAIIASAIARGDANLYLRNVLLRISRDDGKLERLNSYLNRVVEGGELIVQFDESIDSHIRAWIRKDARDTPIDAMGTGILQFLQILAYIIEYRPALVLLDEPDAHLHPNNQRLIALLLDEVVQDGHTQVVLATHSRTLLDAFRQCELASFVWMENGKVQTQAKQEHISMLMDLGALDGGERFYSDKCTAVFLTEDTKLEYIHSFLAANSIDPGTTLVHSYESSSRLQAALELARFIKSFRPAVRVIVHRDRDFMIEEDVAELQATLLKDGDEIDLFVTEGSDIEHYFTRPEHLEVSFGIDRKEADKILSNVLEENIAEFAVLLDRKLDELKTVFPSRPKAKRMDRKIVKGKNFERQHALGKVLLGKIIENVQGGVAEPKKCLLEARDTLKDDNLVAIAAKIPQKEAQEAGGS
jgi:predicted ATPase